MCTPSAGKSANTGPSYDKALQGYVQSGRIKESKFVKPPKNAGESSSDYTKRVSDLRNNFSTSVGYVAREGDKTLLARRKTERQAYIDTWQAAHPGEDPSSPVVAKAANAAATQATGGAPSMNSMGADRMANKLKQTAALRARSTTGRAMLRIGA